MSQLSIELRDAAIEKHCLGKNAEWVEIMVQLAKAMRAPGIEFTSDVLWLEAEHSGIPVPSEPRALGAVMVRLRALRLAAPTSRVEPSRRSSNHARPIRIWRWLPCES